MEITLHGGIIVALGGILPAFAIALIGSKAMEAIGRNPEAASKVLTPMLIGMGLAEAIAIYSFATLFIK